MKLLLDMVIFYPAKVVELDRAGHRSGSGELKALSPCRFDVATGTAGQNLTKPQLPSHSSTMSGGFL